MFLYINKYNIKNNLDTDIYICILDIVVHQDYLKLLSKELQIMLNSNVLIFYIKPNRNDPQDLYYDFFKKHFSEQDKQFINSLNSYPKQLFSNLLDNITHKGGNINFTSYEIEFNVVEDLIDKNYTITTYDNLTTTLSVIPKIKSLFI
jgi:hypothetical protein